jgi:hypothetical protein
LVWASLLGIGDKLRLGKGMIQDGGRQNPSFSVMPLKLLLGLIIWTQVLIKFVSLPDLCLFL